MPLYAGFFVIGVVFFPKVLFALVLVIGLLFGLTADKV
jgi:hypothetical protein